jgi:hypothetical protein
MSDEHRPEVVLGRTRDGAHGAHRPLRVRIRGLPGQTGLRRSAGTLVMNVRTIETSATTPTVVYARE